MDKLSQFYLNLATDANLMSAFNHGNSSAERAVVRKRLLQEAGVKSKLNILDMSQEQLREHIADNLAQSAPEWQGLSHNVANSNTDNNVSCLGRRHIR